MTAAALSWLLIVLYTPTMVEIHPTSSQQMCEFQSKQVVGKVLARDTKVYRAVTSYCVQGYYETVKG